MTRKFSSIKQGRSQGHSTCSCAPRKSHAECRQAPYFSRFVGSQHHCMPVAESRVALSTHRYEYPYPYPYPYPHPQVTRVSTFRFITTDLSNVTTCENIWILEKSTRSSTRLFDKAIEIMSVIWKSLCQNLTRMGRRVTSVKSVPGKLLNEPSARQKWSDK